MSICSLNILCAQRAREREIEREEPDNLCILKYSINESCESKKALIVIFLDFTKALGSVDKKSFVNKQEVTNLALLSATKGCFVPVQRPLAL